MIRQIYGRFQESADIPLCLSKTAPRQKEHFAVDWLPCGLLCKSQGMPHQLGLTTMLTVRIHLEVKKDSQRNSTELFRPTRLPGPNLRWSDIQHRLPQSLCKAHQLHVESGIIYGYKRKALWAAKGRTEHFKIFAQSPATCQHIAKTRYGEMFKIDKRIKPCTIHAAPPRSTSAPAGLYSLTNKRFTQDIPRIFARTKKDKRFSTGEIHKTYRTLFETQNLTTPKSCLSHFSNSGLYSTLDFFSVRACS